MADRNSIQVLERAFLILEEIAKSPNTAHTVSQLSGKTGLKVPTVSKIVRTMNSLGYLEFAGRRCGYLLGHKTVELSRFYHDVNPLRRAAPLGAGRSAGRSTTVFQAPQAGHLPCHFGVSLPHSVQ